MREFIQIVENALLESGGKRHNTIIPSTVQGKGRGKAVDVLARVANHYGWEPIDANTMPLWRPPGKLRPYDRAYHGFVRDKEFILYGFTTPDGKFIDVLACKDRNVEWSSESGPEGEISPNGVTYHVIECPGDVDAAMSYAKIVGCVEAYVFLPRSDGY